MFFVLAIFFHFATIPNLGGQVHAGIPQPSHNWCPGPILVIPDIKKLPRPHQPPWSLNFVPFKILYLIDTAMSSENKAKLEVATQKVNAKLSQFLQAPALTDIRYAQSCKSDQTCADICHGMVSVPNEYIAPGLPRENKEKYTLMIWMTVAGDGTRTPQPPNCPNGVIAFAAVYDFGVNVRPTHGYIVWCEQPKTKHDDNVFDILLHETIHVLLPTLVGYPDPSICAPQDNRNISLWEQIKKCTTFGEVEYNWIEMTGGSQKRKKYISKLLHVRDAARAHFGCDDVAGAELNYHRDQHYAQWFDRAHWSQTLCPDEVMSPISQPYSRLSNLTFSALKSHENWYKVDMNHIEPMIYSKPAPDLACDVPNKPCFEILNSREYAPGVKSVMPYCYDISYYRSSNVAASLCAKDQRTRFFCDIFDECPVSVVREFNDGLYDHPDCSKATNFTPVETRPPVFLGTPLGPDSICIMIISHPRPEYWENPYRLPLCVQHECRKSSRTIQLKFRPGLRTTDECFAECQEITKADERRNRTAGRQKGTHGTAYGQSNQVASFPVCGSNDKMENYTIICPDYKQLCPTTTTGIPAPTQQTEAPGETDEPETLTSVSAKQADCMFLLAFGAILAFSTCC